MPPSNVALLLAWLEPVVLTVMLTTSEAHAVRQFAQSSAISQTLTFVFFIFLDFLQFFPIAHCLLNVADVTDCEWAKEASD